MDALLQLLTIGLAVVELSKPTASSSAPSSSLAGKTVALADDDGLFTGTLVALDQWGCVAASATGGATVGGIVGSYVPVVGTAVGAGAGAVSGATFGIYTCFDW